MNSNPLNTDLILNHTKGGLDIYQQVLEKSGQHLNVNSSRNYLNPVYKDNKPSLSIYSKNGKWLHKDFGNETFTGDCFNFYCDFHKIDINNNFKEILEKIATEFNISYTNTAEKLQLEKSTDYSYWDRFSKDKISQEALNQLKVYSLKNFTLKKRVMNSTKENPIFAFKISEECFKIYQPSNKNGLKHLWLGSKPEWYRDIFGISALSSKRDATVYITEGLKDSIVLKLQGYEAIGLDNASTKIDYSLILNLKERCKNIILCFDNDETGIKQGKALSKEFNVPLLTLPKVIKNDSFAVSNWGKDISDFIEKGVKSNKIDSFLKYFNEETNKLIRETNSEQKDKLGKLDKIDKLSIYATLPRILQDGLKVFKSQEEKDVFLYSSLGALSVLFPKAYGIYDGDTIHCNLYVYVIANAGSGKGTVKYARKLVTEVNNQIREKSKLFRDEYENDLLNYEDAPKNAKPSKPIEPEDKRLFIPANNSAAGFCSLLADNEEEGLLLFETEGDTLSNSLKTDYGDFSDVLRKGFHHEAISSYRKTNRETIEIEKPKISFVVISTFGQFKRLVPDAENGLMSRFMYYLFDPIENFKNVFDQTSNSYDSVFSSLSYRVLALYRMISNEKITIKLTEDQIAYSNQADPFAGDTDPLF